MIKIWRVEDKDGIGCYQGHLPELERMYKKHNKINPLPFKDKGIRREPRENEICGFINKEQAFKWFNKYELKNLKNLGFDLKEIKVAKITAIGERQVLAIRDTEEAKYNLKFELP